MQKQIRKQQKKQNELINQQTQIQTDELNREKEKIDKEEKAETAKNESDYNKMIKELGNKTEDGSSKVGDK